MKFLLWSNKHGMWWRPRESGYTQHIEEAGRYSQTDAERIVARSSVDGALVNHRTDPVTGAEYQQLPTVAVPAPEDVPAPE